MSFLLKLLSFLFLVLGSILFLAGLVLVVYSFSDMENMLRFCFLSLFGVLLLAIGFILYEESVYREVYDV